MIIGFDGSRAFVKDKTGTENYSYQLLVHLAKIDSKNSYLVYLRPGNQVKRAEWPANFSFKMIEYNRFWTQLGLGLQTFKDKIDLLFVSAHTLPLIKRPGLKTVMTVHDLGAEYLPATHQLKQRLYLRGITKFQLKSATKLIAVSKATKKDLIKRLSLPEKKISVVYEGVDRELFKRQKDDVVDSITKEFDIERENYFLFIGTIQPRKNLERLIESFKGYKEKTGSNIKLVIVGGKGWRAEKIYALPKKLGIERDVLFLGRVETDKLPALLSGAKVFVFPSLFEGFGLPILEAFSCGCPVLTSNSSSMPEIAGGAAILVDPKKIDSILSGLTFMENKQVRSRLIADGYKQLAKFSWEQCAKNTLSVLEEVNYGR